MKSKEQLLSQCEEKDDAIMDLQQKVNNANEKLNEVTEQFVKTEQAKNLEISHLQNQIQKIKGDLQIVVEQLQRQKNQDELSADSQMQLESLQQFQ